MGEESADSSDSNAGVTTKHIGTVSAAVDPGVVRSISAVGTHINIFRTRAGAKLTRTARESSFSAYRGIVREETETLHITAVPTGNEDQKQVDQQRTQAAAHPELVQAKDAMEQEELFGRLEEISNEILEEL